MRFSSPQAPLLNWLLYYPVEKLMSRFTDGLITINAEDFENTKVLGFASPEIYRINGVGVNTDKFGPVSDEEKKRLRKELGYSENDFILIYAAEFIYRKNHRFIIKAIKQLREQIHCVKIIFARDGVLLENSKILAEKEGIDYIDFIGYRTDLNKWMAIADVCLSSSRQEGLGLNVAEAMFCGLPVVVSQIRGHVDLVTHRVNGLMFEEGNTKEFIQHILELYHSPEIRKSLGKKTMETVVPFGIEKVIPGMTDIYQKYLS